MNTKILIIFSFLLFLISNSSQNPNSESFDSIPTPSPAHKELENYGFPAGLLPATTILGYAVNKTSGDFSVDIGGECQVTLPPDNYEATYSSRISGNIVKGRITKLDGIRVRAFFKWWSITGIRSTGDEIVFEVGVITVSYPSKNFDESPVCEGRYSAF